MWQLAPRFWVIAAAVLGTIVPATAGRADPGSPPVQAGQTTLFPKLYGFCVDAADSKHRTLPEQARMLHELGFDGAGYELWLGEDLDKNLRILDQADLKLYLSWIVVHLEPGARRYNPGVPEAIRKLKGRPTTVCVLLHGFPPGDPRGMDPAVKTLRELGDLAAQSGLRISIYHHTGDWAESILQALDVAKKTAHPQVGVNFNLCHWLMVDGKKDYRPVLRENAAKIFVVTINGAKLGAKTWTNGLIQPLDQGDFDNRQLLSTLREIGYRGPIALMCYGIPGDAQDYLERSKSTTTPTSANDSTPTTARGRATFTIGTCAVTTPGLTSFASPTHGGPRCWNSNRRRQNRLQLARVNDAVMGRIPFADVKLVGGIGSRGGTDILDLKGAGDIIRLGVDFDGILSWGHAQDFKVAWPFSLMFGDPTRLTPFVLAR